VAAAVARSAASRSSAAEGRPVVVEALAGAEPGPQPVAQGDGPIQIAGIGHRPGVVEQLLGGQPVPQPGRGGQQLAPAGRLAAVLAEGVAVDGVAERLRPGHLGRAGMLEVVRLPGVQDLHVGLRAAVTTPSFAIAG
jgi:hypothetical protein